MADQAIWSLGEAEVTPTDSAVWSLGEAVYPEEPVSGPGVDEMMAARQVSGLQPVEIPTGVVSY